MEQFQDIFWKVILFANSILGALVFVYQLVTPVAVATLVILRTVTLLVLDAVVLLVVYSNFVQKLRLSTFQLEIFSIFIVQKVFCKGCPKIFSFLIMTQFLKYTIFLSSSSSQKKETLSFIFVSILSSISYPFEKSSCF